jgi:hypothetical protein
MRQGGTTQGKRLGLPFRDPSQKLVGEQALGPELELEQAQQQELGLEQDRDYA